MCGVFGIFAPGEPVARLTYFGIYALQHRGQESAGIVAADAEHGLRWRRDMGLVSQVFDEETVAGLDGDVAIGHTRYSTSGSSSREYAQPLFAPSVFGPLAMAHNGNLVNLQALRQGVREAPAGTDSELALQSIVQAPGDSWEEKIAHAMARMDGAYCLVMLTPTQLITCRDPLGVRPLCLGRYRGGWVVASESCALETIGAEYMREIEPGELVTIDATGVHSRRPVAPRPHALCVFEYIYFARPDSVIEGRSVYEARYEMGRQLAREHPVAADLVIGVPDSATAAASGYAAESGLPFREGLIKNRYIGRTFIQPHQRQREAAVALKYNALPSVLTGQRVVVVDDSIVRGTTTGHVVGLLRKAGAKEIHLRITEPPMTDPCYLGIDVARKEELIAARLSVPEIARALDADSLGYLSLEGLEQAVNAGPAAPGETATAPRRLCSGCFTSHYPVQISRGDAELLAASAR
ncbi:MAG TPA: amidophosphoribosyltransferase [Chloroflexota bacterium]|nr:amidophosphoribosyltransferase [Chloroflexota bacterium]